MILTPILTIIVTLFAIELFLAIFHPVPYSIERNMFFEPDPYTGYRLRPDSEGFFQHGIPATVNSQGHRDDEVPMEKPEDTFRILLLGDSFTVGANVYEEQAYPQVLEELLNARSSQKIEVVNTGVGGWEPFMYAQYYEHYGRQYDPDLILIGFFIGNDAYNQLTDVDQLPTAVMGRRVSRAAAGKPYIRLLVFLHEHSNLWRLLTRRGPQMLDFTRENCADFTKAYLALQGSRMEAHLKRDSEQEALIQNSVDQIARIQALAAEDGIPIVVALLPDENQINPALQQKIIPAGEFDRYDFDMPQTMLEEMFNDRGIPTIDLLPTIRDDPRCLYMNDTHWTPEGHRLAAETLANALSEFLP